LSSTDSQPRVPAWLRELYTLVDAGQLETYLRDYYADDVEMRFGQTPVVHGKEEARRLLKPGHDAHDMAHTFVNVWELGDDAIVEFDVTYTFPDEHTVRMQTVTILQRRDGLISKMRVYLDPTELPG
jgi:ketosteroid isomerase-like protein